MPTTDSRKKTAHGTARDEGQGLGKEEGSVPSLRRTLRLKGINDKQRNTAKRGPQEAYLMALSALTMDLLAGGGGVKVPAQGSQEGKEGRRKKQEEESMLQGFTADRTPSREERGKGETLAGWKNMGGGAK